MVQEKYAQERTEYFRTMGKFQIEENRKSFFEDAERIFGDTEDFGCICVCAVRYALGRQTYMPRLVQAFCMRNINMLDTKTLNTIIRDVAEHGQEPKSYGMEFDYRDWMRFRGFLENEVAKREKAGETNADTGH